MGHAIGRRRFLGGAAAGTGLLAFPAWARPRSEPLRLAVIGHLYNAGHFFSSIHSYEEARIVAICDPEEKKIADVFRDWEKRAPDKAGEHYRRLLQNRPATYGDFRKMLSEMGDRIDGLVVSVFDHLHGPICGAAMRAGKHVFSERPLGLTIREARQLRELAARQKVATSIRNPGNASNAFRRAVEIIREGAIGPVEEVHVWFPRGGANLKERPQGSPPVPEGLHWDAWLGPVAARPYHPQWMGYAQWREFCNGGIGTFGPHAANLAFMALRLRDLWDDPAARIRVRAEVSEINALSFPRWEIVRWQVPARGPLPAVSFTWHHGPAPDLSPGSRAKLGALLRERGLPPEREAALFKEAGVLLLGRDGAVVSDSHNAGVTYLPEGKFKDLGPSAPRSLRPSKGHYKDWLAACRGGEAPWANFDYAGPLSEFLMLGNLATRFDAELEYDPAGGRITNHAEAGRRLGYEYREGWTL
jgi:hypothetical protein